MASVTCAPQLQVPTVCSQENTQRSPVGRPSQACTSTPLAGALSLRHWGEFGGSSSKLSTNSGSKALNPAIRHSQRLGVVASGSPFSGLVTSLEGYGDTMATVQPLGSQAQQMQRSAEADVMGLLLRQRIIFLGHELNDYVADATVSQLLLLDAQDPNKDIRMFINCPGGSMSAAMGIFDAIQLCRAPVSTIAFGIAASTATLLLAGGSKGKRFAMPNARIMMHQPLGGASGQAIDVEIQAKEIMHHKRNITSLYAQITEKTYEQVEKHIDRDRYMSPVEAMEYGIIDGVIDRETILPLLPVPERVKPRAQNFQAEKDPLKFLIPTIPDDEIY